MRTKTRRLLLLSEAVLLAGVPALVFVLGLIYQLGWIHYYGVPLTLRKPPTGSLDAESAEWR